MGVSSKSQREQRDVFNKLVNRKRALEKVVDKYFLDLKVDGINTIISDDLKKIFQE